MMDHWLPTPTPSLDTIIMGAQSYEIYTKRQQWISVATIFDLNVISPRVKVSADLAAYFTNANTIAFTVFKDLRSVVAMKGDLSTRKFISGKLPLGKQITVVVISKQGNDYFLGHESAVTQTTASNPAIQPVKVVPKLEPKTIPKALENFSTPLPTKAKSMSVTAEELCRVAVDIKPIKRALKCVPVCF